MEQIDQTDRKQDKAGPGGLTLDDQLCFALYAATNAVTRSYRPLLAEIGLTYPQYLVMLVLWEETSHRIADLSARLRLAPNAVGPLLDRLIEKGLVDRRPHPDDRRSLVVSATKAGLDLHARAARVQARVVCATTLSPTELSALRETLHDLSNRMEGDVQVGRTPAPEGETGTR